MANATDNRNYGGDGAFAQTPPKSYNHKVGAAVEIFAGTFVGVLLSDTDLPIVPLTLDGTTEFRGIATQHINNLAGAKGDMRAQVACETAKMQNGAGVDACTSAHLMMPVYALDNQTVANNDGGGARPCVGMLVGFNVSDGLPVVWADATYAKLIETSSAPDRPTVRYATTGPLAANTYANGNAGVGATLTGNANGALATIDGQTPAIGDKVLVQFESAGANNGVYNVTQLGSSTAPYILTRELAHAVAADLAGSVIAVEQGTFYAGAVFVLALNAQGITVGTTALPWTCISGLQLSSKPSVRMATTAPLAANTYANGTLGAGATLTANANGALAAQDGITPLAGDRLFVQFEAAPANNGIYVVTQVGTGSLPYILTRAPDHNSAAYLAGSDFLVEKGTIYSGVAFQLALQPSDITVGTTALTFVLMNIVVNRQCRIAATAALNLATTGLTAIDGVTPVAGDRVLVTNQASALANGVYIASAGAWSLAPDYATGTVKAGMVFEVSEGTAWGNSSWKITAAQVGVGGNITVGTTDPAFYPRFAKGTTAAMTAGSIVVNTNIWLLASLGVVMLTENTAGGTVGTLKCTTRTSGKGGTGAITVASSSGTDTSTVDYLVVNW